MSRTICWGICLLGCLVLNSWGVEAFPGDLDGWDFNATVAARSSCGSALFYKQYCYHLMNSYITWAEAEVMCQELKQGGHLASIRTSNEAEIVFNYLKRFGVNSVWIGLQAAGNLYMIWQWSDGSSFFAPLWDGSSPSSNVSANKCVSLHNLYAPNFPKWRQRSCSDTMPFLCKYRAGM